MRAFTCDRCEEAMTEEQGTRPTTWFQLATGTGREQINFNIVTPLERDLCPGCILASAKACMQAFLEANP